MRVGFPKQQLLRLIRLVEALKRGQRPNARSFADTLRRLELQGMDVVGVSAKSVQRDIDLLRTYYHAPLEYVAEEHGYVLMDESWTFPYGSLAGEELFAAILSEQLAQCVMPQPLQTDLGEAMAVQLAAGSPEDIPADVLDAVVLATEAQPGVDAAVFASVLTAWREARRLRMRYCTPNGPPAREREVAPHALFLSQGAWYMRAFCLRRNEVRNFAIHRIREPEVLNSRFQRSKRILADVRSGNVFDYEKVRDVVIACSAEKAGIIAEREWFPGQETRRLPDRSLQLRFPECPRPKLVWWVLSYAGHLRVLAPDNIRNEVLAAAKCLVATHQDPPNPNQETR